ncbi:TPA: hypothetical protein ACH3X2_008312 [Trebouxia sp. C0005]
MHDGKPPAHHATGGVCTDQGYSGSYTVQTGDALSTIAATCKVSLTDLEAANMQLKARGFDSIFPGDTVCVPQACASASSPSVGSGTSPQQGGTAPVTLPAPSPSPAPSPPSPKSSAGQIWASISGIGGFGAVAGFCAWAYITWQHRQERQLLLDSITKHVKSSDISDAPDNPVSNLDAAISTSSDLGLLVADETVAAAHATNTAVKCTDSLGNKAGIWNSNFDNVRCAVILLAFHRVNSALQTAHAQAGSAQDSQASLMEAWETGTPGGKSALISQITQTLFSISKEDAQALPVKDMQAAGLYESLLGLLYQRKGSFKRLFSAPNK